MGSYVRPVLPAETYLDEDGRPIRYGERWDCSPPDDSYSVVSHPERFRGLHAVADALVDHLVTSHRVTALDVTDPAGRPPDWSDDDAPWVDARFEVLKLVRLSPDNADAAPLTIAHTGFPGVIVLAGALHDFPLPRCGCDACDEDPLRLADELEELVFAVVAGGYQEDLTGGGARFSLIGDGWRRSGGAVLAAADRGRRDRAAGRLAALPGGWQPWEPAGRGSRAAGPEPGRRRGEAHA